MEQLIRSGSGPNGALVDGRDGALYGVARFGGVNGGGTIFRIALADDNLTILHSFYNGLTEGRIPSGPLLLGSDGALYGATPYGGHYDRGTVFKINRNGSGYTILRHFSWVDGRGSFPNGLIESANGLLYGTTSDGGYYGFGTVFQLSKTGVSDYDIFNFSASHGQRPYAPVMEGADGALYGTTLEGGSSGLGTVFKIEKNGDSFTMLHNFGTVTDDGRSTYEGLVQGDGGVIFGVAGGGRAGAGIIFNLTPEFPGYSIVRHLSISGNDARNPRTGVIQGSDDFLYGVTGNGGEFDLGTVFRISPDGGNYQILHHFPKQGDDGNYPSDLIEAKDGFLYGIAAVGGASNSGTIFRLGRDGDGYSVLHAFSNANGDGKSPTGLIEASDGRLFGTTSQGGEFGNGTVFGLTRDGRDYQVLRSFDANSGQGYKPLKGVIEATDGWLYGTTSSGGEHSGGIVFKLRKDGADYTVVLHFPDVISEFEGPSQLTEGSDGALYGTHPEGESYDGNIFKLNKDGTGYSHLHVFGSDSTEGAWPFSGVIEGRDGALYGMTTYRGATLFRINRDGTEFRTLHHFISDHLDGSSPLGRLLEARDGRLYGTTYRGGDVSLGTVYRLTSVELTRLEMMPTASGRLLRWNAVPGVRYRIQHQSEFTDANWVIFPDDVMADGSTATYTDDDPAAGHRFYRLEVLPPM